MTHSADNPRHAAPPGPAGPPPTVAATRSAAAPAGPDDWTHTAAARVLDATQHTISDADFTDESWPTHEATPAPTGPASPDAPNIAAANLAEAASGFRVETEIELAAPPQAAREIPLPPNIDFKSLFRPESEIVRPPSRAPNTGGAAANTGPRDAKGVRK